MFYVSVRFISRSLPRQKLMYSGALGEKKARDHAILTKEDLKVETDTNRLVNYVCGTNLLEEGGEDVKIKADSEYPSWIFKIEPPKRLEELDPATKEYWKKLEKIKRKEARFVKSLTSIGTVHK